jgi:hypothetical protein
MMITICWTAPLTLLIPCVYCLLRFSFNVLMDENAAAVAMTQNLGFELENLLNKVIIYRGQLSMLVF